MASINSNVPQLLKQRWLQDAEHLTYLLAVQPVGPNIERFFRLKQEFKNSKISCIADNEKVIIQLSDMARKTGLEAHVWLDINNGMNRTGVIPGEKAAQAL